VEAVKITIEEAQIEKTGEHLDFASHDENFCDIIVKIQDVTY
jgi:hypothetical protein